MSTKEVSKSLLRKLHRARSLVWWMSNDVKIIYLLLLCVFVPGSHVSYTVNLIKKMTECFLSLLVVLQRLVSEPPGRYKCCLDSGSLGKKRKSRRKQVTLLIPRCCLFLKPVIKLRISISPKSKHWKKKIKILINWYSFNKSFQASFEYQVLGI